MISLTWCHYQGKWLGRSSNPVHPNRLSNPFLHHIPTPAGCIRHFCNENDPSHNNLAHPVSVKKLQLTGGRIGSSEDCKLLTFSQSFSSDPSPQSSYPLHFSPPVTHVKWLWHMKKPSEHTSWPESNQSRKSVTQGCWRTALIEPPALK